MGKSKSNTQVATHILRDLIMSNELAAGSNHLETELADRLGMSRTPVREATLVLQAQGLLRVRPRRGVEILSLSADDMAEVYDILTALESLAAEKAAIRNLTDDALAPLEQSVEDMDRALDQEDREAWAVGDGKFHAELVRLAGSTRLQRNIEMYNDQVRRARALTLHIRPLPINSNAEHRAVLEAIRRGQAKKARDVHTKHRVNAKNTIVDLLAKHGLQHV